MPSHKKAVQHRTSKPRRALPIPNDRLPAFVRKLRHKDWLVASDYTTALRFIGNMTRKAAQGMIVADEALNDLALRFESIRENPNQVGACLFETTMDWHAYLDIKLAEWTQFAEPAITRQLMKVLRLAVNAAFTGDSDATHALYYASKRF